MNKQRVNRMIGEAYQTLIDCGIAQNGKIVKSFRSQISAFGAALATGSPLAAIAFFSDRGDAEIDRTRLMQAINLLLKKQGAAVEKDLYTTARALAYGQNGSVQKRAALKEQILDCALALKLAMNLFQLTSPGDDTEKGDRG